MTRSWKILVGMFGVVAVSVVLSGCSLFKHSTDAATDDSSQAAAAAGTDTIPAASGDMPATADAAPAVPATDAPPAAPDALNPPPAPIADATTPPPAQPDSAAQPAAPSGSGETMAYTVSSGDTLMKIAYETYGDLYAWKKIYEMNRDKVKDLDHLHAGLILQIEKPAAPVSIERNGEKYLIQKGATLGTISDDVYGTKAKWRRLYENNRQLIKDPNRIYAGFYLYYTMTDQDRQELEQFKQQKPQAPLATTQEQTAPDQRQPASTGGIVIPPGLLSGTPAK